MAPSALLVRKKPTNRGNSFSQRLDPTGTRSGIDAVAVYLRWLLLHGGRELAIGFSTSSSERDRGRGDVPMHRRYVSFLSCKFSRLNQCSPRTMCLILNQEK